MSIEELYEAAQNAEDRFHEALDREYHDLADYMRYRTREMLPHIQWLSLARQAAISAWRSASRFDAQRDHLRRTRERWEQPEAA